MNDSERIRIGSQLRKHRLKTGVPIAVIAEKIGYKENTIQAIEDGKFWPSLKIVVEICICLDLEIRIIKKVEGM